MNLFEKSLVGAVLAFVLATPFSSARIARAEECYLAVTYNPSWTTTSGGDPYAFATPESAVAKCVTTGTVIDRVREMHRAEVIACSNEPRALPTANLVARLVELNAGRIANSLRSAVRVTDPLCSKGEDRIVVRTYDDLVCGLACPVGTSPDRSDVSCSKCVCQLLAESCSNGPDWEKCECRTAPPS